MSCPCKKAVNIFESASAPYRIGKTGENVYQEIEFNFSKWLSEYPDAKIDLLIRVPKNGFYLLAEGITESTYLWKPSAFDLANPGRAAVMARMSSGEVRAKSDPVPFEIVRSMDYNLDISEPGPTRPSLMDEWIEDIYEAAARYPKIGEDNYWYVWDVVEGGWKKTDTYAGGTEGKGSIVYVTVDADNHASMSASEIIAAVNDGKFPIIDMLGVYIPYAGTDGQRPIFSITSGVAGNAGIQAVTVLVKEDKTWTWEFTDSPTKSEAVLYTLQSPTTAQMEQARDNIGAAGADDVAADFAARDRLMQKCMVVVDSSPNRWNKDAASTGLLGLDGRLYTGGSYDNYCYYNIGNVRECDVITSYKKQNTAVDSATMMRVVCYDSGRNAVVSAGTSTATQSFTVPSGIASVAICTTKNTGLTYNYMILVNAESAPTDYIPYVEHNVFYRATEDFLPKTSRLDKVNTLLGSDSPSASAATLASGTTLAIDNAPYFIKKNVSVSARMNFETFTSVEVGKGQSSYRGKSVVVDGTNITQVSYNDSGTAVNGSVVAHGLTISDYLQVTMHLGDDGKCEVTINTTSGTFETSFDFSAEWNYSPFVVGAQAMTDVQLGYSCSDIRCPMWVFGDSYLGLWDNRVGGQLRQLGFFNIALVSVAGGRANDGSKATYPDLQRMLALGTPKYIIWALGMNGGDNANIAFLPTLMKLCEDKDIELILYKVPSIPTIDHTALNAFVESTGLRYIDGAAAVGADASGNWYPDMISSDGVHPSVLGAKALAMRYLMDVPEIMQYGKAETVPQMATAADMSDWVSGKTVDAAVLKSDFTQAGAALDWIGDNVDLLRSALESKADETDIPTAVSDLTNDSGYQTAPFEIPINMDEQGNYSTTASAEEIFDNADNCIINFIGIHIAPMTVTKYEQEVDIGFTYGMIQDGMLASQTISVQADKSNNNVNISADYKFANLLPAVTASDNGKFLRVVNGAWEAQTVPAAESASFGGGS